MHRDDKDLEEVFAAMPWRDILLPLLVAVAVAAVVVFVAVNS